MFKFLIIASLALFVAAAPVPVPQDGWNTGGFNTGPGFNTGTGFNTIGFNTGCAGANSGWNTPCSPPATRTRA